MKFNNYDVSPSKTVLANDHYVAINYDCSGLTPDANGVVVAGTLVDGVGVVLSDVVIADNPNGAVVVHGFISKSKLPEGPTDETAYKQITFLD